MATGTGSGAGVSAPGYGGTARDGGLHHCATTAARQVVERCVHARVAVAFMAKHLAGMDSALKFLSTDKCADVRLVCGQVHFLALGLVLGRAAPVRALMLSTGAESTAGTVTGGEFITIQSHVGTNPLHLSRITATINHDHHFARRALAQVAFLHAAMTTAQGFLAEAVADWDGVFAGGSLLAMKENIDRF